MPAPVAASSAWAALPPALVGGAAVVALVAFAAGVAVGRAAVVQATAAGRSGAATAAAAVTRGDTAAVAPPPPAGDGGSAATTDGDGEDDDDDDDDGSDADEAVVPRGVELKMVICVRSDLAMSKGKVAAQVGHAVLACFRKAQRSSPQFVKAWLHRAQAKITLKVDSEAAMDAVAAEAARRGLAVAVIEDAGRTEVEPGTRTVLGIGPAPKHLIDAVTGPKGMFPLRLLT